MRLSRLPNARSAAHDGCFKAAEARCGWNDQHIAANMREVLTCGRIGGIGPAKRVADYAVARGFAYVNHTFTSHLALCASLQPYAGLRHDHICEYPFAPKSVAFDMTETHLLPNGNGEIILPGAPGLGIEMSTTGIARYLVDVEITVKGRQLYRTPQLT